jgi:uncharacterized membrane protein YoaK (UPF0700 family)
MQSPNYDLARRLRAAAAVILAVTSGATDAVSFLALGGAFTSVMTGNLVLLGISLGQADGSLTRQIGAAVVGYVAGCAIGARIVGTEAAEGPIWPSAVTRGLVVEAALFAVYAIGWWAVGPHPRAAQAAMLLGLSGIALGMQSSTVRRFGVSGLSTTYLTGTLTTLVIRLATGGRFLDVARHMGLLVALVCGATTAALLLSLHAPGFVPLVQLLPLGMAVLISIPATRAIQT